MSVIAGTIFPDTHKPLTVWFRAFWWVASQKNGASALGLKRILGLGSYQTAWGFFRLLQNTVVGELLPYKNMVKNVRGPKPRNHKI